MHQSPFRPFDPVLVAGPHVRRVPGSSRPRASSCSRRSIVRMNHCRLVMISSGRSPFSKNFTACVIGLGSPTRSPDSREQLDDPSARACRRSARRARRSRAARGRVGRLPAGVAPGHVAAAVRRPDDRAHRQPQLAPPVTSVTSPNVQIMAMPVPFSGSASGCAVTGHLDVEERRAAPSRRRARGSARRRGGRRARRTPESARAGSSRSSTTGAPPSARSRTRIAVVRARHVAVLELGLGDRRPEVDVPQRRRLDLVRHASRAQQARGTPRWRDRAARRGRSSRRSSTSRPTARACARAARTPSRPPRSARLHSSTKFGRDTRDAARLRTASPAAASNAGS